MDRQVRGSAASSITISVLVAALCIVGSASVTVAQPTTAGTAAVDGPTAAASGSGSISGLVTDTLNDGLPGATVTLYEQGSNNAVATTTTDQQGAYAFSGIQPGDYRVEATHDGASGAAMAEIVAGKTNSVNVVVTGGSAGTGTITGLVTDTQNNRLAGASVTLSERKSGSVVASTTTNQQGEYTFSSVQAGDYRVEATHNGDDGQATGVVVDGKISTIDVVIQPSARDVDVTTSSQSLTVEPGDTFQVTYEYTNKQGSPASAGRIELTTPANVTATRVSGDGTSGLGGSPQAVLYGFGGPIDGGDTLTTTVTYEVASNQPVSTTDTVKATAYLQNSGDTDTSTTQIDVVSSSSPAQRYDTNGQSGIQPGEAQTAIVDLNSGTISPQTAQAVVAALNSGAP